MKSKKLFTVVWHTDFEELKKQLKDDPLGISLVYYSTFGTYNKRADALDRMQVINRIYKRDDNINQATNILTH